MLEHKNTGEYISSEYFSKYFKDNIVCIIPPTLIANSGGVSLKNIFGVYLSEELIVSTTATTDTSFSSELWGEISTKGALTDLVSSLLPGTLSSIGATAAKKLSYSVIQTSQQWTGGSTFSFDVEFQIFETGNDGVGTCSNYQSLQEQLALMTQPKDSAAYNKMASMMEPTYYDILKYSQAIIQNDYKAIEAMLFSVTIGEFFTCSGLIPKQTSMVLSTLKNKNGRPLFATVKISFETYRVLVASEWANIIKR